jgi:hypothetical protein
MRFVWTRLAAVVLVGVVPLLQGCGGPGGAGTVPPASSMQTPTSVSPDSVHVPPMARTAVQPSSVMSSRRPQSAIQPLGWTQLPGAAVFVTTSPDGSIWVLSPEGPAGGRDKYIWHYVNGTWINVPGWAVRLAVGPDNTLWAVNSVGGIYAYDGTWRTMAGGASDISIGPDGSIYVISNAPGGPDGRGIWHFTSGFWHQMPGAAVRIAASADAGTYPGGISPGGYYVTNAYGSIYYYNPASGYHLLSGAATEVQPTKSGGLFALGAPPPNPNGNPIYFNDLPTGNWSLQPGSGVSIATDGTHMYAVGHEGGIYTSAIRGVASSTFAQLSGSTQSKTAALSVQAGQSFGEVLVSPVETTSVVSVFLNNTISLSSTARAPLSVAGAQDAMLERAAEAHAVTAQRRDRFLSALHDPRPVTAARHTASIPPNGSRRSFYVNIPNNAGASSPTQQALVSATVYATTPHGLFYIDDGAIQEGRISSSDFQSVVSQWENIYARDVGVFGSPNFFPTSFQSSTCSTPIISIDGSDPHVTILFTSVLADVAESGGQFETGYFSTTSLYTDASVSACGSGHSNEALLFVGTSPRSNEQPGFWAGSEEPSTMAHEFQHLINAVQHKFLRGGSNESSWLNEGLSGYAEDLNGFQSGLFSKISQYFGAPSTFSVTAFSDQNGQSGRLGNYGASYLFVRYVSDRFGSQAISRLVQTGQAGGTNIATATGEAFPQLFYEWGAANVLTGRGVTSDPRFTYVNFSPYANGLQGPYSVPPVGTLLEGGLNYGYYTAQQSGTFNITVSTGTSEPFGGFMFGL